VIVVSAAPSFAVDRTARAQVSVRFSSRYRSEQFTMSTRWGRHYLVHHGGWFGRKLYDGRINPKGRDFRAFGHPARIQSSGGAGRLTLTLDAFAVKLVLITPPGGEHAVSRFLVTSLAFDEAILDRDLDGTGHEFIQQTFPTGHTISINMPAMRPAHRLHVESLPLR
jgi:hypothetical protein